jgi:hypothetical protein
MATISAAAIQKLKDEPEIVRAKEIETRINKKLNHDGRLSMLHPMEYMARLGSLTRAESGFLGRLAGWDKPYFGGIDWISVSSPFLAECSTRDDGMELLRSVYPAPPEANLIEWAAVSEDDIHLLSTNKVTLKEMALKYPAQTGTRKEK